MPAGDALRKAVRLAGQHLHPLDAPAPAPPSDAPAEGRKGADQQLAPSVRRLSAESSIDAATVPGSGKEGRVTKGAACTN